VKEQDFVALAVVAGRAVLAVNLAGDWLRGRLDPKLRQAGSQVEAVDAAPLAVPRAEQIGRAHV